MIRETHRLTPATNILARTLDVEDMKIHGRAMERGDVVLFESYSYGMNPDLVEDPKELRPERWLEDAVEARRGARAKVIDHPFFAAPFSQGPHRCPGSRVATNRIHVLLSQLVLDWKILLPVADMKDVRYQQRSTVEVDLPDLQFELR